jgi:hypothetical protein
MYLSPFTSSLLRPRPRNDRPQRGLRGSPGVERNDHPRSTLFIVTEDKVFPRVSVSRVA